MQEKRNDSELCLTVTGIRRDGRRRYDPQSKRRLAQACLQPGVSLAGMALKHGVNANLLRKWVEGYRLESTAPTPPGVMDDPAKRFVPVIVADRACAPIAHSPSACQAIAAGALARAATPLLRAQLPNGVTLEFECGAQDAALVAAMVDSLGRCDVPSGR
jgi:transposase